ncbi:MAG TPA: leucine/isoleucine/valine transporter permease subunit, partial [Chloroflexi bacterium]|nr:leucine/isoleucine/valine transporter permease subunit [Chloroflexota bacterium]
PKYRTPIQNGVIWTLTVGLFSEILRNRLRDFFGLAFAQLIFTGEALRLTVAAALFVLIFAVSLCIGTRPRMLAQRFQQLDEAKRRRATLGLTALLIAFLLILPHLLGTYLSEVINNVGIFILMGLGLNIVVGFAGLLDLGYVAFFAIGAYTMAVLTSEGPLGIFGLSFWAALPICVGVAALAGIVLGVPVLRMRGDYLAIVTLGFGEIIRILALSDLLKPFIGGAQGVLKIPKPPFFGTALIQPGQFYYVILGGCLLAWFVSYRLSESRLGRQWMALREDEDVAEAMGIRLVTTKLLAFGIGAAFSGLAGAFFASKLTSIFPHSFKLEISINVLCLIIIGGMGSLPGVVVGALILVGLPELLREFAEYRLLMYGALLIVMMLAKPEGFWPSAVRRRELRAEDEEPIPIEAVAEGAGD